MNNDAYPRLSPYKPLIDEYMSIYTHTLKDIGYGRRRTHTNGMWFDLIDYRNEKIFLRVGRGARLVEEFPILHSMFDTVKKVIATFEIHGPDTLEQKGFASLIQLLSEHAYDARGHRAS